MITARAPRHWFAICICICLALAGCASTKPLPLVKLPWEQRRAELAQASAWQMDGRAAGAVGDQGWQANLNWQQHGSDSEVHLSGPLGVGAVTLKLTAEGVSMNGGAHGDAALAELQDRLGFALPLAHLRYWVLGIPDPGMPSDSTPNDQDRLAHLSQDGWSLQYDRYMAVDADVLPAKLVLSREAVPVPVRVRMSVDRWALRP